jgi:dipeptidyl aminopeptidase/acylaminoacyl peptidase
MRIRLLRVLLSAMIFNMLLFLGTRAAAQADGYQKAPKAVRDVLKVPPEPQVSVSPTRDTLLLLQGERYPGIDEFAEPMLRLAGLRINPNTNGPARTPRLVGLSLMTLDGNKVEVKLPERPRLGVPAWSPDGKFFAFTHTTDDGVELWFGNTAERRARRLLRQRVQAAFGKPFLWLPGGKALLVQLVPENRGDLPAAPRTPRGPVIQESAGKAAPVRTLQDLLRNAHDEALFDYFTTSQLAVVTVPDGKVRPLGKPGIFAEAEPAPDGKHLLVQRVHRPYSYLLAVNAFPREVAVWDLGGKVVKQLPGRPLADLIPIEGVPKGPRQYQWHPTDPASLVWVEALDEGDPRIRVSHRDRVVVLPAPFAEEARELLKTQHRFAGMSWTADGLALVKDYDRDRRWERTVLVDGKSGKSLKPLFERSVQDRYKDPGTPATRLLPNGHRVLRQHGDDIFLIGQGATPKGDYPFLDRFDLKTLEKKRLFRCGEESYETVLALLDDAGTRVLTRHEMLTSPPNYFVRSLANGEDKKALTSFPDSAPQLRGIKKQLVTYKRADGVPLSFTLYLPADYKEGQRLPAVFWAYPIEFNDAATAGQIIGSRFRFTSIGGPSHLFFLTQGYAVLDGPTMPVIGDPETANNTYLEQIIGSAKAAIDKADEMGVIDRNRVGVGGHSYGAFMTANLLAHSDLFRAGVARSGAYNRTLTPFGFQRERRTLWEAPDVYLKMSPFLYAHKIRSPILFIHGEADNNPGTFPVQSERMYQAVKGNGGAARLVMLPHESHGYAARESVEHTLAEMIAWFDRHVKNAPTRSASAK